jgi:P4 family phage/plasmid primase-like protien
MHTYKNLKLENRISKLDNIILNEPIDITILNKLINSDLLQTVNNPMSQIYYENEKEQLIKYNDLINNGIANICYQQTKNIKFGRVLPVRGLGLFCFRKAIRHTLCVNTFEDIDIVAAHHMLLLQICEHNNIVCKYIKEYVVNRDFYLTEVMNTYNVEKDDAKTLFIILLYFGSFANWIKDKGVTNNTKPSAFITKFTTEIKKIGEIIYSNNKDLVELIKEKKYNKKNIVGSVVSYYLQDKENLILEFMYDYCLSNGYIKDNICVLCADGIMITKELYKPELLTDLSKYILTTTGFNLKYINKKMTEDYLNILDLHQLININLWDILEDMNHSDMAKLYCKLAPSKYIYSNLTGWYEYNKFNVLIPYNKVIPPSLLSNVTNTLQKFIINERNKIIPPLKTDDTYEKKIFEYDRCMKLARKGYSNAGNSSYVKSIIDYLSNLYTIDGLDLLLDSNINLLAFNNKLYDYDLLQFRNIEPTDYITKTTQYDVPTKNEECRKFIMNLLYSIFENNEMVQYWLITTGLSLFSNKYESLYIHAGMGGNGKGLLSSILIKSLGEYIYSADNTFLTSIFKSGQANPTLAKCKGIRYLLVSEPDNGTDDVKFNIDFIKMLTGGDIITTRELYKTNISYKPQFTPFVQCNKKPNLGKLDNGVKRRIKIINFPLNFVENPSKLNERLIDNTLKDKLNNDFYKEMILLLIDIAYNHKFDNIIKQPIDVINQTKEYFDENDPVKLWLNSYYEFTDSDKDRISSSDLYNSYIYDGNSKISIVKFSEYMKYNEIDFIKPKNKTIYIKIKRKETNSDTDFVN